MTYYLTVKARTGSYIQYDLEFPALDDALVYINEHYLAIPNSPIRNNAYICLYEGVITSFHMNGMNCGVNDQWVGIIASITIQNDNARKASIEYQSRHRPKN